MRYNISSATAILERTPRILDVWLRGLPEQWLHGNEGPKTFSPFDVVGHLIDGELADWIPRLTILLEQGESRPFDPFDRFAHWERNKGRSLESLLEEFAQLRAQSLRQLHSREIIEADLDRRGTHPALGVVTLRNLLATWVVHDLNHLRQISRAMAVQYSAEVGPWSAYLKILQNAG